ncbi:hypothetical protein IQ231_19335 [Cuspidothrix issatschenkoi LEGE 03284]|jgi:hypothetical protein|uniref:hypothetical protein n=1 Tax=Cuspidothrix issatschenkoi TaxID=230752 RepID=UPI00187E0473|nr:hypothetical protein [Cuspidothrix issatschenkoi]MBE9233762.1 hypothetical protein [Cuspidothrix issatschenkoi LEGE 03284]
MPEASIYQEQAKLNEDIAQTAKKAGFSDWAIIMCFYSALHWVNYHAYNNGNSKDLIIDKSKYKDEKRIPTAHDLKKIYVQKIAREDYQILKDKYKYPKEKSLLKKEAIELQKLEKAYEILFNASMTARYLDGLTITARDYYKSQDIEYYFEKLEIIKKRFS